MLDWHGDHPVTTLADAEPRLARIQRFPVKSLDPEDRECATLIDGRALAGDREWAIVDRPADEEYDPQTADVGGAGDYVNGKKTAAVHRLRSAFHPRNEGGPALTLREHGERPQDDRRFALNDGRDGDSDGASTDATVHADLNDWLSGFFDRPVSVRWDGGGHHDDRDRHGPTVISTATLREVAAWFDFDLASARRRFRANFEIGGVPPFWEDRLFVDEGEIVRFRVGDAVIDGIHPCQRCVVPSRDPDTGTETPGFRERFIRMREETLPEWTDCDRFDHPFRLMVNTRVPETSEDEVVEVGDTVEMIGGRPE